MVPFSGSNLTILLILNVYITYEDTRTSKPSVHNIKFSRYNCSKVPSQKITLLFGIFAELFTTLEFRLKYTLIAQRILGALRRNVN